MSIEDPLIHLIKEALQEDIGDGDHSTMACIDPGATGKAVLKIKQNGILAGIRVAEAIFRYKEPTCNFVAFRQDGDHIEVGDIAFEITAHVHTILQCERLVLNCMQRMSGIATLTRQYSDRLKGYATKLLDTRKTTPNFRLLEKEAVRIGGGYNHRFGLYDMMMLKDNHIDFCGGIESAVNKAWQYVQVRNKNLKIEVETRSIDDVRKLVATGAGKVSRIMLDNFSPDQIREALALVQEMPEEIRMETEASGGITLENIEQFAATAVDFVSVGALIHQAKNIDLSLKAAPQNPPRKGI